MVLRSLKEKAARKFNISIAEVGDTDAWQSSVVGFATVANDRRFVEAIVEKVVSFIDSEAKVADEEKEFIQYGQEPIASSEYAHWEPEEDSPPNVGHRKPRAPRPKTVEPFPWEKKESKD